MSIQKMGESVVEGRSKRDSVYLHYIFISLLISKSSKMLRESFLVTYSVYLKWQCVIVVISALDMEH